MKFQLTIMKVQLPKKLCVASLSLSLTQRPQKRWFAVKSQNLKSAQFLLRSETEK